MERIEALRARLPADAAALILTGVNRRYFTGFSSSLGYLFVSGDRAIFYTDSRYIEAAGKAVSAGCEVRLFERLSDVLRQVAAELAADRLLTEEEIPVSTLRRLEALSPLPVEAEVLSAEIRALRQIKSAAEVACIRKAQQIAEEAFDRLLPCVKPGVSERELALELDYTMRRLGAEDLSFETIVVSGENSSMPHGVPGERRLQSGDFVTFDFGAVWQGYHSDMTRTVVLGRADAEMRRVYDTVLAAQEAGLAVLRPGLPCNEGDRAARRMIEEAGYGAFFGHGAGHSVGLEIHEEPRLSPSCAALLEPGMIMTVEPGIYLPERFGVRIEDMVCITPDGCENLTGTRKALLEL
ncbi:MAG: M24 family metallopeptidase [Candidatus Howiella sp.]|jgi:Xaa-Pro aminopeptidase